MLSVKNLTVSAEEKVILNNISFDFEDGKTYVVMGPNGSGKSTLASSIMGSPVFEVDEKSVIKLNGENIVEDEPNERAEKGLFMSFQTPLALAGVTINNLLRYALEGKVKPLEIRKQVAAYAERLSVPEELIKRSLNDGFSGGERKKMEMIQAAVLDPQVLFFDEIDTGVDVDALKVITSFMNEMKENDPKKTFVIITHNARILDYITPDSVLVIKDGSLVKEGGVELVSQIEKEGYQSF